MSEVDYQGSNYIPPKVAVFVGALLRGPRELGHSAHLSDFFSSVPEERRGYVDGLSVVPVILFSFFFAWVFIVILLKCKGTEVGCASGRAFVSLRPDDENSEVDQEKSEEDDMGSTFDAETISESDVRPLFLGPEGEMIESSNTGISDDNNHVGIKFWRWMRGKNKEDETDDAEINQLERRTRFSFLVFASIALFCATLNLFLTFGPLREVVMEVSSIESPDSFILKIQNTIDEVETSLTTIESLSVQAMELITTVPTDLDIVCPLVNSTDFESIIGVDINDVIDTIIQQQYTLREDIVARLSPRLSFVDGIKDGLSTVETYADEYKKYIWMLLALLLTISGLTLVSITGVILAWKEKSGTRFQRVLSYVVLPLLILVATICLVMVTVLSLSTMIGTDICLSGSSNGTPDQTIQEILPLVGNGTEGTAYQFASAYANHCNGTDPTQDIHDIKLETQKHIDNIWRQISKIDSVGRAIAIERCGNTEEFKEMLTGARNLAIKLTDIRRSLSSLEESTGCSSIHPMYTQAAHDIVCTQTLSASGYGFITFLIIWICVMAMISLRASWLRNNIEDQKVYHDETEIAENMVVDEHEEYLAYISRYQNEWQEYEGIEEERAVKSLPHDDRRSGNTEDPSLDYYYGDDEEECSSRVSKSDLSTLESNSIYTEGKQQQGPTILYQRRVTTREIMDHHDDGVSYASGEISFATFSSEIKNDVGSHGNILTLPPPTNPEFSKDKHHTDPDDDSHLESESEFNPDFDKNSSPDLQHDVTGEEVEV